MSFDNRILDRRNTNEYIYLLKATNMTLQDLKDDMYALIERIKSRADVSDRELDVYDLARLEALMGQIEVFTKQHKSNCE